MGRHFKSEAGKGGLSVKVYDDNIDKAIRNLKKKITNEGLIKEMKKNTFYEKPGDKKRREKSEAKRRYKKNLEIQKQFEI